MEPTRPEQAARAAHVVVTVVRTGGIAGLRRRWRVEPAETDVRVWIALIEDCPWDAVPPAARGADRYWWRIEANCAGRRERGIDLPDDQLDGPWRALVDAVRADAQP